MSFRVLPFIGGLFLYIVSFATFVYSLFFIGSDTWFAIEGVLVAIVSAFITFLVTDTSDKSII